MQSRNTRTPTCCKHTTPRLSVKGDFVPATVHGIGVKRTETGCQSIVYIYEGQGWVHRGLEEKILKRAFALIAVDPHGRSEQDQRDSGPNVRRLPEAFQNGDDLLL